MDNPNTVTSILLVGGGAFSLIASLLDWNWFFENRKARFFVKLFGRTGARVFYTLVGLFLLGFGIKMVFFPQ